MSLDNIDIPIDPRPFIIIPPQLSLTKETNHNNIKQPNSQNIISTNPKPVVIDSDSEDDLFIPVRIDNIRSQSSSSVSNQRTSTHPNVTVDQPKRPRPVSSNRNHKNAKQTALLPLALSQLTNSSQWIESAHSRHNISLSQKKRQVNPLLFSSTTRQTKITETVFMGNIKSSDGRNKITK